MKWIFWFFVVNIVSFFSMKGFVGDGNMYVCAIVAFCTWGLFIRAVASDQQKKREHRNREKMLDEYLRQQLRR